MRKLSTGNIDVLNQFLMLVETAGTTHYALAPEGVAYGIGRHVRHVLDHYEALVQGLGGGDVDYDFRRRDCEIEHCCATARAQILHYQQWLESLANRADCSLRVKSEISVSETTFALVDSTLSRELCYLAAHSMHHLAYANLIGQLLGVDVDRDAGIAPATASYLRSAGSA